MEEFSTKDIKITVKEQRQMTAEELCELLAAGAVNVFTIGEYKYRLVQKGEEENESHSR